MRRVIRRVCVLNDRILDRFSRALEFPDSMNLSIFCSSFIFSCIAIIRRLHNIFCTSRIKPHMLVDHVAVCFP